MEKISSFMDGELDADEAGRQIARLQNDPEARANWDAFHLVGDAMRGECVVSRDFSPRLHARLAAEPTVLAPHRKPARPVTATYLWPAAAAIAAVVLVGGVVFYSPVAIRPEPEQKKLVENTVPPAPKPEQLVSVPSDGTMNRYIIIHQDYSPSTAIQGVAPYIRTVSGVKGAE